MPLFIWTVGRKPFYTFIKLDYELSYYQLNSINTFEVKKVSYSLMHTSYFVSALWFTILNMVTVVLWGRERQTERERCMECLDSYMSIRHGKNELKKKITYKGT